MKKTNKIVTSMLLTTMVLGAMVPAVNAGELENNQAKSVSDFTIGVKDDSDPNDPVINPPIIDEPEIVVPDDEPKPQPSNGPLYVMPANYHFGDLKASTTDKTYDALVTKYLESDDEGKEITGGKEFYLPPMVLVGDTRETPGTWSLQVTASKFSAEDIGDLTGTKLIFSPEVYNNLSGDENKPLTSDVDKIKFDSALALTPGEAVTLMEATNASGKGQTTYVNDPNYSAKLGETEDMLSAYKENERVSGAQLSIPASDEIKSGSYSAELLWTIVADGTGFEG